MVRPGLIWRRLRLLLPALLLSALLVHLITSGSGMDGEAGSPPAPARAELLQYLFEARSALLIYADADPSTLAAYRRQAEILRDNSRRIRLTIQPASAAMQLDLQNEVLLVIGTPRSNPLLAGLLPQLPLAFSGRQMQFLGQSFADSTDVLTLLYPSPFNNQRSLHLLTGNSDAAVLRQLEAGAGRRNALFASPGDYQIQRRGKALCMGFFRPQNPGWVVDMARHRDFTTAELPNLHSLYSEILPQGRNLPPAAIGEALERSERVQKRVLQFLGAAPPPHRLRYFLYAGCEEKGLITGDTRLQHTDFGDNAVHVVLQPGMRGDDGVAEARLLLRNALGEPKSALLETGLAVSFSQGWGNGDGYQGWAARLFANGSMPALQELFDTVQFERGSSLVYPLAAGSFCAFLRQEWGREKLLREYAAWQPDAPEIQRLQAGWNRFLAAGATGADVQATPQPVPAGRQHQFERGFCFAHEGYQIYNGYGSQEADRSLQKLQDLHCTAISITPFSYMPDPSVPNFLGFSRRAGSETDESVIHSALSARAAGMTVMLKPHLWLGHGSWPGAVEMQSEEHWKQFFDYYGRWMRHYALLAEMNNLEYLCIGVELARSTLLRPEDWRRLIRSVRGLYSGKLVYAANWGEEFEQLSFWDELDYIGLNCYYPLSDSLEAGDAALREGVASIRRSIAAVASRYRRPVMLTEIGFTATPGCWIQPHEVSRGKGTDPLAQRRAYEAIFAGLQGMEELAGIYWWKWPSYLEDGGLHNNDFTPNGKPAEALVGHFFSSGWPRPR